jgi:hypothetical protein
MSDGRFGQNVRLFPEIAEREHDVVGWFWSALGCLLQHTQQPVGIKVRDLAE